MALLACLTRKIHALFLGPAGANLRCRGAGSGDGEKKQGREGGAEAEEEGETTLTGIGAWNAWKRIGRQGETLDRLTASQDNALLVVFIVVPLLCRSAAFFHRDRVMVGYF